MYVCTYKVIKATCNLQRSTHCCQVISRGRNPDCLIPICLSKPNTSRRRRPLTAPQSFNYEAPDVTGSHTIDPKEYVPIKK